MQLLAQRKAQLHTTSKQELDGLRALIERDFTDAALTGLGSLLHDIPSSGIFRV